MKHHLFFCVFCLFAFFSTLAQSAPYRVVFDLTSGDTSEHRTVLRWINGITSNNPDAQLQVVFYGKSLPMITQASTMKNEVAAALQNKNVSFKVCEASMKRQQVDKSQLLPGVTTVPDGIYEIVSKEQEGWGYIKVIH